MLDLSIPTQELDIVGEGARKVWFRARSGVIVPVLLIAYVRHSRDKRRRRSALARYLNPGGFEPVLLPLNRLYETEAEARAPRA